VTTQAPKRRRSQAQRTAEMRTRLLDATIDCLVKYGYAGTTTPRIAEMAGVTRGAQVHHFGSREDLMLAAVEHLALKRMSAAVPKFGDGVTKAEDPVRALLDIAWDLHGDEYFIPVVELWVAGRTDAALGKQVARFEVSVVINLTAAVAEFLPEEIHRPMLEFIYLAMDALRGILISSLVDTDPLRARRRWERAAPGLRRSVAPELAEWIAARQ
jgi:AcrR family transcriptional regulator